MIASAQLSHPADGVGLIVFDNYSRSWRHHPFGAASGPDQMHGNDSGRAAYFSA